MKLILRLRKNKLWFKNSRLLFVSFYETHFICYLSSWNSMRQEIGYQPICRPTLFENENTFQSEREDWKEKTGTTRTRRMNSLLHRLRSSLSLSFSRPLSENRPQSRELTTNNYRLKFPRNKVSLDNILGAMSLCFSASGFIEYRRLDVSLSSKEPQYVFELFRIARIFSLYSYSSNPSSPVSIFLSFKSRESMSQYDESLISYS